MVAAYQHPDRHMDADANLHTHPHINGDGDADPYTDRHVHTDGDGHADSRDADAAFSLIRTATGMPLFPAAEIPKETRWKPYRS